MGAMSKFAFDAAAAAAAFVRDAAPWMVKLVLAIGDALDKGQHLFVLLQTAVVCGTIVYLARTFKPEAGPSVCSEAAAKCRVHLVLMSDGFPKSEMQQTTGKKYDSDLNRVLISVVHTDPSTSPGCLRNKLPEGPGRVIGNLLPLAKQKGSKLGDKRAKIKAWIEIKANVMNVPECTKCSIQDCIQFLGVQCTFRSIRCMENLVPVYMFVHDGTDLYIVCLGQHLGCKAHWGCWNNLRNLCE